MSVSERVRECERECKCERERERTGQDLFPPVVLSLQPSPCLMFMVASCAQNTASLAPVSVLSRPSLIIVLSAILLCCFCTLRNIPRTAPGHSELPTKTVHDHSLAVNYCLCLWSSYSITKF